jgi:large subunit ribosomal protein L31e
MAKQKKAEPKLVLEREYIVPLRKGWLKVPKYKRGKKAVKTLKEFLARHMKVYDRDLRKIKVDIDLNNEIRFRGMKKPPAKIKVKAVKYDNGIVRVEIVDIPEHIKFKRLREEKKQTQLDKKAEEKEEIKKITQPPEKTKEKEETQEAKEKEEATKDESLKLAKEQAKEMKHVTKEKKNIMHRVALEK